MDQIRDFPLQSDSVDRARYRSLALKGSAAPNPARPKSMLSDGDSCHLQIQIPKFVGYSSASALSIQRSPTGSFKGLKPMLLLSKKQTTSSKSMSQSLFSPRSSSLSVGQQSVKEGRVSMLFRPRTKSAAAGVKIQRKIFKPLRSK